MIPATGLGTVIGRPQLPLPVVSYAKVPSVVLLTYRSKRDVKRCKLGRGNVGSLRRQCWNSDEIWRSSRCVSCRFGDSGDRDENSAADGESTSDVSPSRGARDAADVENSITLANGVQEERKDGDDDDDEDEAEELIEEYLLEETGSLSEVKVSLAGSSRSPTVVEYVVIKVKPLLKLLQRTVQNFSLVKFVKEYGKEPVKASDIQVKLDGLKQKEGVDSLILWTSTDLTLQHAQMVRIAKDTRYLVLAFGLFGIVRIIEAVVVTFTSKPVHLRRLLDASNALDPLTVAWLAHGMRKPMVGLLKVDPSNVEEVNKLKIKFWKELHLFYERQWKVMATLGIARLFNLIATHHPAAKYVTGKLQFVWNVMLSLPLF